jgi:hypothetical protein
MLRLCMWDKKISYTIHQLGLEGNGWVMKHCPTNTDQTNSRVPGVLL